MEIIGWVSWLALFVGSGAVDQKAVSYLNNANSFIQLHPISPAMDLHSLGVGGGAMLPFYNYMPAVCTTCDQRTTLPWPCTFASWTRMRALTTKFNDRPQEASRPFDSQRSGFVIGEGAGIMILEVHCADDIDLFCKFQCNYISVLLCL